MPESISRAARQISSRPSGGRDTSRVIDKSSSKATDKVDARARPDTGKGQQFSRRFRVAVFAPSLDFNGTALHTITMVRALVESGDQVLLSSPPGPMSEGLKGVEVARFDLPPLSQSLGFFGWRKLKAAIAEFEPEILHAITPDKRLPAVRVGDAINRSVCVSVQGVKQDELPRVEDENFDGYIASDAAVREKLINECRLPRKLVTQINLAAAPVHPPEQSRVLDTRATPAVGMIGPLDPAVGFGAYIDAVARIGAKNVKPIFTILGDGPRRSEVRKFVEDRGLLQRIVLVDRLYDYSLAWRPFDIVFIDTRQPSAGVMVLSAMACGLPVVATQGGAVFDIIEEGVDGLLVARDDEEQLAQRLLMLIENHAERLRMAKAAYAKIETQYQPERMADALHATYAAMEAGEALPRQGDMSSGKRVTRVIQ